MTGTILLIIIATGIGIYHDTNKPTRYELKMEDGSNIAFFDLGDNKGTTTDCDDWVVHFAFNVSTKEDVDHWCQYLKNNNIDVIGPTNHDDWIYSIYFFDPNGLR